MRAGFAITNRFFARRLEDRLGPWALSGPTLEVASAALIDTSWADEMRATLSKLKLDTVGILRQAGLDVLGSTDLFIYVSTDNSEALFNHLLKHKVYVRHYPERPGYLRFGLPRRRNLQKLEKALTHWKVSSRS